ncbi:MAG: hypothetical protein GX660_24170 [Clostridiaceae bacterium]|nr:hypothetical protein [Clostridiaceae bacterium]
MEYDILFIPSAVRHIGKTHAANASAKFCQRAFQPISPYRTEKNIAANLKENISKDKNRQCTTNGIANKGFRGIRRFSLASNVVYLDKLSLRNPLLAIPSTVSKHGKKASVTKINATKRQIITSNINDLKY